jgi:hypothetical protein
MRITKSVLLALMALFSVLPSFAQAADVAVFPAEGENVAPQDRAGIGELLAQSYAAVSRLAVLSPSRTEAAMVGAASYSDAAQKLGVKEFIRTETVAIGRRVVIQATRYQSNGQLVFTSRMTAESIEDMTNVADRMARALYQQVDDSAVRTYKNVTLMEARPKNRLFSEKVIGLKTGLHIPLAKDAKYAPHMSLEFDMRLEQERYFLEFGAGAIIPTKDIGEDCYGDYGSDNHCYGKRGTIGGLFAEMGASAFLTQGNVALYAGGGVIPQLVFSGNSIATAALYGQIGVMLPRESSTRFYADLRVAQYVLATQVNNDTNRHPTDLSLNIGIGW